MSYMKSIFWAYAFSIFCFSKLNQHLCGCALTCNCFGCKNPQFSVEAWHEITILLFPSVIDPLINSLTVSEVKSTFLSLYCKFREIVISVVRHWRDNKYEFFYIPNISETKQTSVEKNCRMLLNAHKQNHMQNFKRFGQTWLLFKIPNALFNQTLQLFQLVWDVCCLVGFLWGDATQVINPELLGSWCSEVINESSLVIDFLAALVHHDLSYLGPLILTIIPKECAYLLYTSFRLTIPERLFQNIFTKCQYILLIFLHYSASRYAKRCPRSFPHDTTWEASHDVQCHTGQRDPPCLQEIYARCNYTSS